MTGPSGAPVLSPAATAWMNNAAILLMGDTGSGKTTLIETFAEHVWKKHRKRTRYYSFDAGGFGDMAIAAIEAGILEVWRPRTRDVDGSLGLPVGTMALATMGHWPVEVDPKTGISPAGVQLVGPSSVWHSIWCKNAHLVKRVQGAAQLQKPTPCPVCKALTSPSSCKEVKKEVVPNPGFEDVGAYAFDGMTSMCDWGKTDVNYRAGKETLGGIKGNLNTLHSSGLVFGTAGMGGVGFVQDRAQDWIYNAINIRGTVAPPVFTALELKATDKETSLEFYGPKLIGNAKTLDVPSWVGNCLGPAIVTNPDTGKIKHRLYLDAYALDDGVFHLCKNRAAAVGELMPPYLEDPDGATIENGLAYTEFNLGTFLDKLDAALEQARGRVRKLFPDAPGIRQAGELKQGLPPKQEEEGEAGEAAQEPVAEAPAAAPQAAAPPPAPVKQPGPTAVVVGGRRTAVVVRRNPVAQVLAAQQSQPAQTAAAAPPPPPPPASPAVKQQGATGNVPPAAPRRVVQAARPGTAAPGPLPPGPLPKQPSTAPEVDLGDTEGKKESK